MPKPVDVPAPLKPFNKIFESLAGYRHDAERVFSDFIEISISNFQFTPTEGLKERIEKTYDPKEIVILGNLFKEYVRLMNEQLQSRSWYDALGQMYEALASSGRRSGLGQFFTPMEICDMMTSITVAKPEDNRIISINDPACGSGRTLLSTNAYLKGRCVCFAEDMDHICAKMAVLNFLVHGVVAEVIHHDSLSPNSFFAGWHVNPVLRESGVPSITPIKKEDSYVIKMWEQRAIEVAAERSGAEQQPKPQKSRKGIPSELFAHDESEWRKAQRKQKNLKAESALC